jgi:hypothetical protein
MASQLPAELNFKFSDLSIDEPRAPLQDEQIADMDLPNITKRVVNEEEIFDKDITEPEPEIEQEIEPELDELPELEAVAETPKPKKPRKTRTPKPPVVRIPQVIIDKPPSPIKDVVIVESNEPPFNPLYKYGKDGKVIRNKNGSIRMKRVYSEEQKKAMTERLAKARANRNKNADQRNEEKRLKKIQADKDKELMKKKKIIEEREIEEKMIQHELPPEKRKKNGFSKSDIEEIQLDAIVKYETLRKQRKEKKRQEALVQQEKQNIRNTVKQQLGYKEVSGIYSGCF